MPTGPPDFDHPGPNETETVADRIIREAMEAGEFDDLAGQGKPIPGAGTVDDEGWWIRSWVQRNRDHEGGRPPSDPPTGTGLPN